MHTHTLTWGCSHVQCLACASGWRRPRMNLRAFHCRPTRILDWTRHSDAEAFVATLTDEVNVYGTGGGYPRLGRSQVALPYGVAVDSVANTVYVASVIGDILGLG
jgi:hypothetical protein